MKKIIFLSIVFCLVSPMSFALDVMGTNPGNANDSDPTTFHFSADNTNFQMTRSDGTLITASDVPLLYGSEIMIYQNGKDFIAERQLEVIGADLSGSQWTNSSFPAHGFVAIDPATGRFKFSRLYLYENQRVDRSPSQNSTSLVIDINNNNESGCLFRENQGADFYVYSRYYTPSTGWISPYNVWTASHVDYLDMGMDDTGKMLCVMNIAGSPDRIYSRRFVPGSGWVTSEIVDSGNMTTILAPEISVNSSGDAIYSVEEYPGSVYHVFGTHYQANYGWSSTIQIDSQVNTASSYDVDTAINATGDAICVYYQNGIYFSSRSIYANHYSKSSGSWQSPVPIAETEGIYYTYPRIAMNDRGDAVCIYYLNVSANEHRIYASHYQAGMGWSAGQIIYTGTHDIATSYFRSVVDMDESGNAACVFTDSNGSKFRVVALNYLAGQGWQNPTYIDDPAQGDASHNSLRMSSNGFALCAFQQKQSNNFYRAFINYYYPKDGWQTPVLVDSQNNSVSACMVSINSQDRGLIGINQFDGSYYRLYTRFLENQVPVNNAQVKYSYVPVATSTPTVQVIDQTQGTITNRQIKPLMGDAVNIHYDLAQGGVIRVKVYNLKGREILTLVDDYHTVGSYSRSWSGKNSSGRYVASGIYLVKVKGPGLDISQKVAVIK